MDRDAAHDRGPGTVSSDDRHLVATLERALGKVPHHGLDTSEVREVGLVRVDDAHPGSVENVTLDGLTILLDCRWLGMTGIGRATELLLHALARDPPPGRWVLWAREPLGDLAWPEAVEAVDDRDPRRLLGLAGIRGRPAHDVAVYPPQIRPFGTAPTVQLLYDATPVITERRLLLRRMKRTWFRLLGRSTVKLVCSEQAALDLEEHVGIRRADVRTYAYPADDGFGERVREERRRAGSRSELLFVGRDAPHKNLERLVAAHLESRWSERGVLVLVGPGTERFAGIARTVVARGAVNDTALVECFARARALVLPSLNEGFGLPVLEAQVAGLPVLASDRPPISELLVPGWDLAFDPLDQKAITLALDALVADDLPLPGARPVVGSSFADYRSVIVTATEEAARRIRR